MKYLMDRAFFAVVAMAAAVVATPARATPSYTVVVSALGTQRLYPSSDTITLNANSTSTSLGNFGLQTGTYSVGDSGWEDDVRPYQFSENVTINGEKQLIHLTMQNTVRNPTDTNTDFLTIFSNAPVFYSVAGVDFSTQAYISPAFYVGGLSNFSLTANLSQLDRLSLPQQTVPEPMTLALFAVGLLGIAALRRRPQLKRA